MTVLRRVAQPSGEVFASEERMKETYRMHWWAAGRAAQLYAASAGLRFLRRGLGSCSIHLKFIIVVFRTPVK